MSIASVDYNIVGASGSFTFSVKYENSIDERFLNIGNGKIYFTASGNGTYKITVSKGDCQIKNSIIINNPANSTPTTSGSSPTSSGGSSVATTTFCTASVIGLTSISDLTAYISINNFAGSACTGLETQYSSTEDFAQYTPNPITCANSASVVLPSQDIYYIRVVKYCGTEGKVYSNFVLANTKSNNCFIYSGCQVVGSDPHYDTYKVILKNPATEDIQFTLSNSSIITVDKGNTSGEGVVNISIQCPYAISNSMNLVYCRTLTPALPIIQPIIPSTCVKVYAVNDSNLDDIITFTLCDGSQRSYSLPAYGTSGDVCIINENAWISNIGQITIHKRGVC